MRGIAAIYGLTNVQIPYLFLSWECDLTIACVEYIIISENCELDNDARFAG